MPTLFSIATLPGNEYALTGNIYLNPADFQNFKMQSSHATASAKDIVVNIKGFILRAEPLADIPVSHFGANGVHREMMQIGKMD